MKYIFLFLLLCGTATAQPHTPPPIIIPSDSWTINGTTYQSPIFVKSDPESITIKHADGVAKIPIAALPEEMQKALHYDPALAAEYRQSISSATEKQYAKEREQETIEKEGKDGSFSVLEVLDKGVLVRRLKMDSGKPFSGHGKEVGTPFFIEIDSSKFAVKDIFDARVLRSGAYEYVDFTGAKVSVPRYIARAVQIRAK